MDESRDEGFTHDDCGSSNFEERKDFWSDTIQTDSISLKVDGWGGIKLSVRDKTGNENSAHICPQ